MDMYDWQMVTVYHDNTDVYTGLWGEMDEDMQVECKTYGDMYLLSNVEYEDVVIIICN